MVFDERVYVIYNILPPSAKVSMIHKLFMNPDNNIVEDYAIKFFKNTKSKSGMVNTVVFKSLKGSSVNIFIDADIIHVNANDDEAVAEFVKIIFTDGNILQRIPCKKDKRFYLPSYKKFIKLNGSTKYPMCPN